MRRASIAAILLAGSAGGAAYGQGIEGSTLTATVSERFEVNDNYDLDDPSPGTSYFSDTRLTLGYLNQTPTQNFALGFSTGLRALWQAEQPFEFTLASPTGASLDYDNEWANGLFDMAFDYRQRQVDYTETIVEDGNDDGLPDSLDQLQNDTRELRYDANVGVIFGTATPSSYELRFIGSKLDYTDVTPDQVPRTTLEGEAAWNLQLNPILASRVTGNYIYYNADNTDETELRRASVGAGVVYTPNENASVGVGPPFAASGRSCGSVVTNVTGITAEPRVAALTTRLVFCPDATTKLGTVLVMPDEPAWVGILTTKSTTAAGVAALSRLPAIRPPARSAVASIVPPGTAAP